MKMSLRWSSDGIRRKPLPRWSAIAWMVWCLTFATQARERLDGIAAVVSDSVITVSELEAYTLLKMNRMRVSPDSVDLDKIRDDALQELIDGKVLLVHAEKDTNITVKSQDVEEALERRIQTILRENGITLEELDRQLRQTQGMGVAEFRKQMRRSIREQLLKQKVSQYYVANVSVTRKDVKRFYEEYKDSLPSAGKSVRLSRLTVELAPSDSIKQAAYERIRRIQERLQEGEEFEELARAFSQDPNAEQGGDLGFVGKGSLNLLRFEDVAFRLSPGEISDIFETKLGFHIIKVEARKEGRVRVRQILIRVAPPREVAEKARALLDSIREHADSPESFEKAVRRFSTDELTRSRGGDMGWQSIEALDPLVRSAVDTLQPGMITSSIEEENTLSIYRVDDRVEQRPYTLEDDWEILAEQARNIMTQKKMIALVRKWRKETFVDIRQ